MSLELPVPFKGAPGSPYTRKMLALLRYRRVPYRLLIGTHANNFAFPAPKVALLPTFYLPNDDGEIEAVVDSTPLIRRLENELPERRVVPTDPFVAFVDYLLEDYADEWLTKAMFHYRWQYRADIGKAGQILWRWRDVTASEAAVAERRRELTERQIGRLHVVGSTPQTAPVIEASYRRFLDVFDEILKQQAFLMGSRPGASDFGVYGQLTQLARFDPTPAALTLEQAPRVYAWVDVVEDLSGLEPEEDGWLDRDALRDVLKLLLAEVGRVYAPVMVANATALESGADRVEAEIDGGAWVQQPFPYQGKCLAWLRGRYAALGASDRAATDAVLSGTGCEILFADT